MQKKSFEEIYQIMLDSFPTSELRTREGQLALWNDEHYRVMTEADASGKVAGFLAYWRLPSCVFIEHLAVTPRLRGSGIGAKLVSRCLKEADGPVFLEIEVPADELGWRRAGFYERLGFHMTEVGYLQPKFKEEDPPLPLVIMSWPKKLAGREFERYRDEIFWYVYQK